MNYSFPRTCLLGVLIVCCASATRAETVTQTVTFPAQLFYETAIGNPFTDTFTAEFDQFDPTLGTLDVVSFELDFDFDMTLAGGGGGGSVSGLAYLHGEVSNQFIGDGTGAGGGPGVYPFDQLYLQTFVPGGSNSVDVYVDDFTGTGTISISADFTASPQFGPPTTARFDLVEDSGVPFMKLVYEFTPGELDGDYNADGTVNIADYAVWRNNLGSSATLHGDTTPGSVTTDDFEVWKSNFGGSIGLVTSAPVSVPEPSTMALVVLGAALVVARGRWQETRLPAAKVKSA